MGGDLGGTEGTVTPNFEVGDGPCIRPPNISRSIVVGGCVRKYELSKKGVIKDFFRGFSRQEKAIYICHIDSVTFHTVNTGKILKRSSEIFGVKMEIFSQKRH